jgi:hypothetical protein
VIVAVNGSVTPSVTRLRWLLGPGYLTASREAVHLTAPAGEATPLFAQALGLLKVDQALRSAQRRATPRWPS